MRDDDLDLRTLMHGPYMMPTMYVGGSYSGTGGWYGNSGAWGPAPVRERIIERVIEKPVYIDRYIAPPKPALPRWQGMTRGYWNGHYAVKWPGYRRTIIA